MAHLQSVPSGLLRQPSAVRICQACRHRNLSRRLDRRLYSTSPLLLQQPPHQSSYVPAQDWNGLEWVGTKKWIYERRKPEIPGKFFDRAPVLENDLEPEFLAALAEVLIFRLSGRPLAELHGLPVDGTTNCLTIKRPKKATPFTLPPECREWLLKELNLQDVAKLDEASLWQALKLEALGSQKQSPEVKEQWKNINLSDLNLRLAVVTRVMKRTGRRIADADINRGTSAGALFSFLKKKREKAKLAKVVSEEKRLDLPNVTLKEREVLPENEDLELGRWKIIREELEKRWLPEFKFLSGKEGLRKNELGISLPVYETPRAEQTPSESQIADGHQRKLE